MDSWREKRHHSAELWEARKDAGKAAEYYKKKPLALPKKPEASTKVP